MTRGVIALLGVIAASAPTNRPTAASPARDTLHSSSRAQAAPKPVPFASASGRVDADEATTGLVVDGEHVTIDNDARVVVRVGGLVTGGGSILVTRGGALIFRRDPSDPVPPRVLRALRRAQLRRERFRARLDD